MTPDWTDGALIVCMLGLGIFWLAGGDYELAALAFGIAATRARLTQLLAQGADSP